jgi:precorrin-2 methylase
MIRVLTATRHHHGREPIERWFGERVQFVPLSNSARETITRDYLNRVVAEIHEGVQTLPQHADVYFLMTGHPMLNAVAMYALRQKLGHRPFLVFVYDGMTEYHAYSSDFLMEYLTLQSYHETRT